MDGDGKAAKKDLITIIRTKRMTFLRRLTLAQTDLIAGHMYSMGILITAELESLKAEKTPTNAASCLLDFVDKKGVAGGVKFLHALRLPEVGLKDVADEISSRTSISEVDYANPCNEPSPQCIGSAAQPTELKRRFRRVRPELISQLDMAAALHVVDVLYAREQICETEKQKIEGQQTLNFTVRCLIDVLDTRSDDVLKIFLEALRSEHIRRPDLAKMIDDVRL